MTISCCASRPTTAPATLAAQSPKNQPAQEKKPACPSSAKQTCANQASTRTSAPQKSSNITSTPAEKSQINTKDAAKTSEKVGVFRAIGNWFKNFFNDLWTDLKLIFSGPEKQPQEESEQQAQPKTELAEQKPEKKTAPAVASCCQGNS